MMIGSDITVIYEYDFINEAYVYKNSTRYTGVYRTAEIARRDGIVIYGDLDADMKLVGVAVHEEL